MPASLWQIESRQLPALRVLSAAGIEVVLDLVADAHAYRAGDALFAKGGFDLGGVVDVNDVLGGVAAGRCADVRLRATAEDLVAPDFDTRPGHAVVDSTVFLQGS